MKTTILLFFIFLVLCSVAYAQPPFQDVTGESTGIQIRIPQAEYIEYNLTGVISHIHIFNSTNSLPLDNTTVDCFLHLYNRYGVHVLQEEYGFDDNGYDFEMRINETNLTTMGAMSYIIWCNASDAGGFVAGSFEVTDDGFPSGRADSTAGIAIVIFILFIVSFLLFVGFKVDATKSFYTNLIIKRSAFVLAIYLMVLNSAMMATIAGSSNLSLTKEMFTYMTIFGYAGYLAMVVLCFKTIIDFLEYWKMEKNKKINGEEDNE